MAPNQPNGDPATGVGGPTDNLQQNLSDSTAPAQTTTWGNQADVAGGTNDTVEIPEKFQGKTMEEVVKAYNELDARISDEQE